MRLKQMAKSHQGGGIRHAHVAQINIHEVAQWLRVVDRIFHRFIGLAQRLGYGDLYPQSEEDMLRFALEPSGFTLEEVRAAGGEARVPTVMMQYKKWEKGLLRPGGQPGFNTPSGKFEIASSILAEHGDDPLPV
jgi:hypothetical protein